MTTFPVQYGTYNWTSPYGPRIDPLGRGSGFHWGVDVAPKQPGLKVPLYSPADGVVTVPSFEAGGAGNNIWITDADAVLWKMFHMDAITVRAGQRVKAGERVGTMGTTGASTGVHVHIERWKNGTRTDPTSYLRAAEQAGQFPGSSPAPDVPPPAQPITPPEEDMAVPVYRFPDGRCWYPTPAGFVYIESPQQLSDLAETKIINAADVRPLAVTGSEATDALFERVGKAPGQP